MIFGAISSYVYLWKGGRISKASISFINYHVSVFWGILFSEILKSVSLDLKIFSDFTKF